MAQFSVQGSITVRRLRTGATLSLAFDVSGALAQVVNVDTGDVSPDWTQAENQPTITPRATVTPTSDVKISVDESSGQGWWYNSSQLLFNGSRETTDDGWLKEIYSGEEGPRFAYNSETHALRIINNLASKTNYASDTLKFTCLLNYEGNEYEMSASQTIAIMPGGTSGYNGYLYAGTQVLDESVDKTKVHAYLWNGDSVVQKFSTKWYVGYVGNNFTLHSGDGDGNEASTTDGEVVINIARADVNGGDNNPEAGEERTGGTLFICEFYNEEGSLVAVKGINIMDEADEYSLQMTIASDSPAKTLDAGDVKVHADIYSLSKMTVITPSSAEWSLYVLKSDMTKGRTVDTQDFLVTADDSEDGGDVNVVGDVKFTLEV